jgi:ubiquinone/menaquinone biosynthesis C-methylase UbiE
VLDVAVGAGGQTLDIAQRVGPRGSVLATDLSPDILQFAKRQTADAGHRNVQILTSDGESLQIEDARFDAVVCRMGLMLFRDPLLGLREMKRVLKPDGFVCTMVFSAPDNNPCMATPMPIALPGCESSAHGNREIPPLCPTAHKLLTATHNDD